VPSLITIGNGAALGCLIAVGGLVTARTLHALRGAEDAEEIAMMMPFVSEQLSNGDDTVRRAAAALVSKYSFLARQWDVIADLLDSDTEMVRLGALRTLGDLVEAADHKDYDLTPVVPSLLRVFAREGRDCKKTRVAAARVLNWLILRQGKMSATSFVLNGVDLMGCRGAHRAQSHQAVRGQAWRGLMPGGILSNFHNGSEGDLAPFRRGDTVQICQAAG
jgi:hypothetical protein